MMEHWELIIIGAGPAGLTAGIYGVRSGLKTLILEEKLPGGAVAESPWIENYPGFPEGIRGNDLVERMLKQCERFGVAVRNLEKVIELRIEDKKKFVKTDVSLYSADAVIIASGCRKRVLGVPGEEEFRGRGVSYCAVCDGAFFKGGKVLIVGGGNSAAVSAVYLSNVASKVYLAHRRSQLRAEEAHLKDLKNRGVEILWNTELKEIKGDSVVKSVLLLNNKTNERREIEVDGVFILIGEAPNSDVAVKAGIKADEEGYIIVDSYQRTNLPGVYAAGDVTVCPVKQIGTAIGQSIIAANEAFGYIKRPYYYKRR